MAWRGEARRVLIEADPAGGTLAAAGGLSAEPGLVSLAAAARRQPDPASVFDHAQALPDGSSLVCGPPAGEQARSALSMLGSVLGRLGQMEGLAIVDCGRLDPKGPNVRLFHEAGVAVLVCRPQLADLNALAAFLQAHPTASAPPLVVLIGSGPYPADEIAKTLGVEIATSLPWDPEAALLLMTLPASARRLTRTPLVRALRSLADDLAERVRSARSHPADDSIADFDDRSVTGVAAP
jgi:hypothetical protein